MKFEVGGFGGSGKSDSFERNAALAEKYSMSYVTVQESEVFEPQPRLPAGMGPAVRWTKITPYNIGRVSAFCVYTAQHYADANPGASIDATPRLPLPSSATFSVAREVDLPAMSALHFCSPRFRALLEGVPLGLIISAVGSTTMSHWAPQKAIDHCGLTAVCAKRRTSAQLPARACLSSIDVL